MGIFPTVVWEREGRTPRSTQALGENVMAISTTHVKYF